MDTLSFEQAFEQLETAVEALQDGQMPLERALNYFEEGMKLAQYCNELLEKAEFRVQKLRVTSDGIQILEPFE
jgi:exodeoxyribonuclease VII small subunit